MKYRTHIFQKHWDVKTNLEFWEDCKWTLKQRSFFQLSIIIKDMSCVNNIDQKHLIHAFIISDIDYWDADFVRWSNNLLIWVQSVQIAVACLDNKSPATEACPTFSSFSITD